MFEVNSRLKGVRPGRVRWRRPSWHSRLWLWRMNLSRELRMLNRKVQSRLWLWGTKFSRDWKLEPRLLLLWRSHSRLRGVRPGRVRWKRPSWHSRLWLWGTKFSRDWKLEHRLLWLWRSH